MQKSLYLIAGLGKTGFSIARFLKNRHLDFVVFDSRQHPPGLSEFEQEFPGVTIYLSQLPEDVYPRLIEVISSPGVALDSEELSRARDFGIPIIGDVECLARAIKAPVVAITGTNGKSTVTTLVGLMAEAQGLKVAIAGNIGSPVLDLLDDGVDYDLWVLELSSFQLDLIETLAPLAATILNITPDHLDRHHHFDVYVAAKHKVYRQAKYLVYNRDDDKTTPNLSMKTTSFGLNTPEPGCWGILKQQDHLYLAYGDEPWVAVQDLHILGRHNWANAMAAMALATMVGIQKNHIQNVLRHFKGLAHRSQWVRRLDGVDWFNDSKGTNVGATVSAIAGLGGSIDGKVILIAGGQGKGASFDALQTIIKKHVRKAVLIGEDATQIEAALSGTVPLVHATSMEHAIDLARKEAHVGDVVLLSPACASFDMFRDFNHRGEVFTDLVLAL